ncbi:MAG: hypothetical protein AB7F82_00155 [Alphaproteobacteria bacterium]
MAASQRNHRDFSNLRFAAFLFMAANVPENQTALKYLIIGEAGIFFFNGIGHTVGVG